MTVSFSSPGEWAGDGKTEMGVYCQGVWFLDSTGSGQWDGGHTYWSWAGSLIPVVGDWTGSSAKSQFGVYNQGAWFLDYDNSHLWDAANQAALTFYGWAGAQPVVGNWGSGFQMAATAIASLLQPAGATPSMPDATLPPWFTANQTDSEPAQQQDSPITVVPGTGGGGSINPGSGAGEVPACASQPAELPALNPLAVDRLDLAGITAFHLL